MLSGITVESANCLEPAEDEIYRLPWKYIGYKGFTSFVSLDQDFLALRRFDRMHTRVLISLQAQLQLLETELDDLDAKCASKMTKLGAEGLVDIGHASNLAIRGDLRDVNNGTILDDLPVRQKLISDVRDKLVEYDDILTKYSAVRSLFPAPKRNIRNIEAWLKNNPGAIMADEASFIDHHDELISISKPKAVLRQWFEENVVYRTRNRLRLFHMASKRTNLSDQDQKVTYIVSEDTIEVFGSIAVFIAATAMLIAPLWLLQMVENLHMKLAVITIFVFVCLVFLSCATLGRPFERLAATAGYLTLLTLCMEMLTNLAARYAAVLVVFLQTNT